MHSVAVCTLTTFAEKNGFWFRQTRQTRRQFFLQRIFAGWRMITFGKMTGNETVFKQPIKCGHFWI